MLDRETIVFIAFVRAENARPIDEISQKIRRNVALADLRFCRRDYNRI